MADLTFKVEKLPQIRNGALVKIKGSIDAKSVKIFQEKLDELQEENYKRFILDMEGISYVNSTGLGTLVNVADALENKGGGIALIKIHPKVKVVFDMLGLNAFFKIYSTQDEALNLFKGAGAPESSVPKPPPSSITQSKTSSREEVQPKSSHLKVLTTKATPPSGPGSPFSLICAICKVKLNIPKPGSYKCPRCATFFKLYDSGQVKFSERKKAQPLQMKLTCTEECKEGLSEFIAVLSDRIGFTAEETEDIRNSIKEICGAIIEKAYENKQYLSYNVVIEPSSTELGIQFSDYGQYIYDDRCFELTQSKMDKFRHKQHPKGGNVVNFIKRVG